MEFFFPVIAAEIDWTRGYEFLDKELAQITRDHRVRRKLVDKLVKVWLSDGTEKWLLIHLEVQASARKGLAKRIYIYNYRIFDRYDVEVVSLRAYHGRQQGLPGSAVRSQTVGLRINISLPGREDRRLPSTVGRIGSVAQPFRPSCNGTLASPAGTRR